jgi:uncharacterized protein (DUF1330 family)
MPAYLIADIELKDSAAYQGYVREVSRLIERHGGTYLARGGQVETIEGEWAPRRLVIVRFPDMQAIRDFFADPDYQSVAEIRWKTATSNIVAVDGVE